MTDVSNSEAWVADRDHFIHPYTDFRTFQQEGSQVIGSGEGMHVVNTVLMVLAVVITLVSGAEYLWQAWRARPAKTASRWL